MEIKNKTFDIKKMQKKGQAAIGGKMTALIGGVVIIFLAVALLPEVYTEVEALSGDANVPTWLYSVLVPIVGAGFIFIIWRTFN